MARFSPVVGDVGGVVPAVQGHGGLEVGGAGSELGGLGVSAGDFIGEEQFEKLVM